ncbi:hypothetical protein ACFQ9J_28545 [Streptomyces sp. NPDC056529]|uniref:hypothetical protein n=1 Tax=Streptomyces sp. NPDC056529 TaxID=3345855 RepID=UPI003694E897
MITDPPDTYLDTPVPTHIRDTWTTWDAATWRTSQHHAANQPYPPDMRFTVRPPAGMCPTHRQAWIDYRNMRFNEETGDPWPGNPMSPFLYVGTDVNRIREERRVQWDRKASEQMRLIERICLSGRSPQCTPAVKVPGPRPAVDVHLPAA